MKDGETVVIGGLLKDIKTNSESGVPFLSKIPVLGWIFKRETNDTEKIDLLIFLSANVLKEGQFSPDEIAKLEAAMDRGPAEEKAIAGKKRKRQE